MPADTDSHTGTDSHTDTAQAGADLNGLLRHTFDQSRLVIGTVGADDVSKTTPCPAFDVRTLVGHMLFAAERIGAAGRRTAGESDNAVTVVPDDQQLAEEVLPLARQVIRLEFRGEEPMPFGAEVAVAAAAPATDRLAGFMGRRPQGTMRG